LLICPNKTPFFCGSFFVWGSASEWISIPIIQKKNSKHLCMIYKLFVASKENGEKPADAHILAAKCGSSSIKFAMV